MLSITRKKGQSVVIGNCATTGAEIGVTVTEIGRGEVRLIFEAPRKIPIFRSELLENGLKKAEQNQD